MEPALTTTWSGLAKTPTEVAAEKTKAITALVYGAEVPGMASAATCAEISQHVSAERATGMEHTACMAGLATAT